MSSKPSEAAAFPRLRSRFLPKKASGPAAVCRQVAVALALFIVQAADAQPATVVEYTGMAEASAAVMLDETHFVVAEDECNTLLVYRLGQSAPVGQPVVLASHLETGEKASDLEGAARVGDVIYWISSHSLPMSGKPREWRRRFFATKIDSSTSPPTLRPIGVPHKTLLDDLMKAPQLKDLKLAKAAKRLPEMKDGLNIEGLAEWDGGGLLIGFRNPLRDGDKAAAVPLTNPTEVIKGKRAQFGKPFLLDLGGRGIRSIERIGSDYVIVAGPVGDNGTFAIYRWSGNRTDRPTLQPQSLPIGLVPEALFAVPGTADAIVLSDDGTKNPVADCGSPGKAAQRFRAFRFHLN